MADAGRRAPCQYRTGHLVRLPFETVSRVADGQFRLERRSPAAAWAAAAAGASVRRSSRRGWGRLPRGWRSLPGQRGRHRGA
ncbi:hypothetical protein ppKF707_1329 [Metapseudomonas furukawaii]|uniref:Uncharacterized protein n=1 Tax=Metapseudomonas furukawaii TaxID=1149133 RepID=A0AAD1C4P5_METFU|nr:hypothetical protein ppKF707_1329 [Pseudomonas furukawaii]BAU75952.1 hypothetical protein KF707C_42640 [Pseudomonas furukawaii]